MAKMPNPVDDNAVWAVDPNHPLRDALTWVDELNAATVETPSVSDLVRVCQYAALDYSSPIDFLAVFGHGTGGYQGVGCGQMPESSGERSLKYRQIFAPGTSRLIGNAEIKLRRLNGVLSQDAVVLLAGCSVGAGSDGTGLLTTISGILNGRRVQAFENNVYWWTGVLAGSIKEAKGSSVASWWTYLSISG
jgi:hypothetical protein